jgi:glycosyltransferase involved in cell wall biosynthesis
VLITGGHEIGGVGSFAEGLRDGFRELGIAAEILAPERIASRWREVRDPHVLKILSTTAVFAAPFARRAICMAHGVPQVNAQGWKIFAAVIGSYKLANSCAGAQLIAVSHYTASTLEALFRVRTDAVIHNPLKALYLEPAGASQLQSQASRGYITYLGRLTAAKNLHRILPAIHDLLDETPGLRMCIVGEGPQRAELERLAGGDARFEFKGAPDDLTAREWLRQSRIFISGNVTEGFGIAYLEALSQGCVVVMPASGGGLEIAPESLGGSVQLFPLSLDRGGILATLRRALAAHPQPVETASFSARSVAEAYLRADRKFSPAGRVAEFAGQAASWSR